MSERKKGPYWVRRAEGDASQGPWEIMHWEGSWFRAHTDARWAETEMQVIGPRIDTPDAAVETALAKLVMAVQMADDYNAGSPSKRRLVKDFLIDSDLRAAIGLLSGSPAPRLSITPDVYEAADEARTAFLRDQDGNDQMGALHAGISAAFAAKARARLPIGEGVEAYPLDAMLWKRESTGEWVVELSGSLGDTAFNIRHPQPGDLTPVDAVGLPALYDLLEAAEGVAAVLDVVEDIPDVVYLPADDITSDEVRGTTAAALRRMLAAHERATNARLHRNIPTTEGDVP